MTAPAQQPDAGPGFAIVGCGTIAATHARAVERNGARLVGAFDERPARAGALVAQFGGRVFASIEELLADGQVEVVSVCTPSGTHADVAVAAAEAGKHLLIEKPIDVTLERARRIVSAAESAGVRLSVVSQHRFDDSTRAVRQALDEGRIGRPFFASAQVLWYRTQDYYDRDAWRGTWALDGGGALMNQSIHSIDLLRYLVGDVERVAGRTATVAHSGIEVEDLGLATLRFRSGALGSIVGTTAAYPGYGTRIEVFGDRGAARIEDDRLVHLVGGELETGAAAATASAAGDHAGLAPDSHARQVADLLAAIRERRPPLSDGTEGLRTLEVVLAIYESARAGREVDIPLAPANPSST